MNETQLMKGILECCILAIIAKQETYGYEILQVLTGYGFGDIQEGTLYPILTRLEKKGYISCRRSTSPLGPVRKYFSATEDGLEMLSTFKSSYKKITSAANELLFKDEVKENEN